LRNRSRSEHAYLASCGALFAALGTAAVGILPNLLPARNPKYSLPIYDAAVLVTALWWWMPGMLLVIGYFIFIHRRIRNASPAEPQAPKR
jgi:cytochrome bd-type quinol oxidase subunit 2